MQAMKTEALPDAAQEIELKLALPASDPASLSRRLARIPPLARRRMTRVPMRNVYYDTPDQTLHRQGVALRIRRKGTGAKPQWLQTLKTGGRGGSALSSRGEWESPLPGATLSLALLQSDTPWPGIDMDGGVFRALAPCFATEFERTSWLVRRRDGSVVEVALDIGQVSAGDKRAPICELELELLAGQPQALFDTARQIAAAIAVLPLSLSKSDRGYALAHNTLDQPVNSQPPTLKPGMPLEQAAQRLLLEMFNQFTSNLDALRASDDPEVVHQARVGWRRFRTAWRLFGKSVGSACAPDWSPLQALTTSMGELRDLDVARTETLPPFMQAFTAGDTHRTRNWQALSAAMMGAANLQRKALRHALEDPAVGATLLATVQWLEGLSGIQCGGDAPVQPKNQLRRWAARRVAHLHDQLQEALREDRDSLESQHRIRILSKRLRYGMEALCSVLPSGRVQGWHRKAIRLQERMGATRDRAQASLLAARLDADRGLVEFLRGICVGWDRRK
jgi:inorganic triphosphatase YgiF